MDKTPELNPLDRRTIRMATEALQARYHPRTPVPEGVMPFRKCPNRRLYSYLHHRYVNLEEVARWWLGGMTVIVEGTRGEDLTIGALLHALASLQELGEVRLSQEQIRALVNGSGR